MNKSLLFGITLVFALAMVAPQAGAATSCWMYPGSPTSIYDYETSSIWFDVTEDFAIQDLDVEINITHTWVGDLEINLISPNNTWVSLSNRNGAGGDNFWGTYFDDEASTPISSASSLDAPFTGSWIPDGPLSALDGESTLGTWTLNVTDHLGGDTGLINSFSIYVEHEDPSQPVPEPKTLALFGLGLIGLAPLVRRSIVS